VELLGGWLRGRSGGWSGALGALTPAVVLIMHIANPAFERATRSNPVAVPAPPQSLESSGSAHLVERLTRNVGFGMGLEFRESHNVLGPKNSTPVKAGQVRCCCWWWWWWWWGGGAAAAVVLGGVGDGGGGGGVKASLRARDCFNFANALALQYEPPTATPPTHPAGVQRGGGVVGADGSLHQGREAADLCAAGAAI